MRRLRGDHGQALVLTVLCTLALFGIAALVIDAGSWFTAQRKLQRAADAATLAGAQDLPNTSNAAASANTYASLNESGLNTWSPTFPDTSTINVSLSKAAPGFFAKALGISSVTVHAHARAKVGAPGLLRNALPIAVKTSVACAADSLGCFNSAKTITFDDSSTTAFSSSTTFGLLDLSGSSASSSACTGNVGESVQKEWITSNQGYPGLLAVDKYFGASTGQRQQIQNALNDALGKILLIPVYDTAAATWCTSGGFHVVGWAAFVIDQAIPNSQWNPHFKQIRGHFTEYIVHDVDLTPGVPGFGVKVVKLTE